MFTIFTYYRISKWEQWGCSEDVREEKNGWVFRAALRLGLGCLHPVMEHLGSGFSSAFHSSFRSCPPWEAAVLVPGAEFLLSPWETQLENEVGFLPPRWETWDWVPDSQLWSQSSSNCCRYTGVSQLVEAPCHSALCLGLAASQTHKSFFKEIRNFTCFRDQHVSLFFFDCGRTPKSWFIQIIKSPIITVLPCKGRIPVNRRWKNIYSKVYTNELT